MEDTWVLRSAKEEPANAYSGQTNGQEMWRMFQTSSAKVKWTFGNIPHNINIVDLTCLTVTANSTSSQYIIRLLYTVARSLPTQERWLQWGDWSYEALLLQIWHTVGNCHRQRTSIQVTTIPSFFVGMKIHHTFSRPRYPGLNGLAESAKKEKMTPVKSGHP